MSKVNAIRPDYFRHQNSGEKRRNSTPQSFGGEAVALNDDAKKLFNACRKGIITKTLTFSDFLKKNEGEVENQLINNFFTATLAPLVIATNPLSNKDKKDKEYAAWRQPISAAIAIVCSLPLTILVNNYVSKLGSEGNFDKLDMRIAPHRDYLKFDFKKEYKEHKRNGTLAAFEDEVKLDDEYKELRNSKSPLKKIYYKACLKEAYNDKQQKEASAFFAKLIGLNPKDAAFEVKDSKVTITDKKTGNLLASRKVPNMASQAELDEYLKRKNFYYRSFGDFMQENFGFEFLSDGRLKPDETIKLLRDTRAKEFFEKTGMYKELKPEELAELISSIREDQTADEIKELTPDSRKIAHALGKQGARQNQAIHGERVTQSSNISLNQLFNRLDFLDVKDSTKDVHNENKLSGLKELMDKPVSEVIGKLQEKLKKHGFHLNKEDGNPKAIADFAETHLAKMSDVYKEKFNNVMKYSGIFAAVFIVMGTCTVLNWVYPRFMEKFLPQLCKTPPEKAKKGGNE